MKQAVLLGRTAGLRPSVERRLERIAQRRHPESHGADLLSLQRLAQESLELELPLSLVIDGRGLCRLLWIGPLEHSGRLLERLPASSQTLPWCSSCHRLSCPSPPDSLHFRQPTALCLLIRPLLLLPRCHLLSLRPVPPCRAAPWRDSGRPLMRLPPVEVAR